MNIETQSGDLIFGFLIGLLSICLILIWTVSATYSTIILLFCMALAAGLYIVFRTKAAEMAMTRVSSEGGTNTTSNKGLNKLIRAAKKLL